MANYIGIQGQNILIVSSDPANPTEGQIWYNSTSNLLKGYALATVNAFASGGNMNTARFQLAGAGSSNNSALAFGGNVSDVSQTATELYNGTSWTSNPTGLNTGRQNLGGAGTQTAALAFAGQNPPNAQTESWDGSSWTSVNSMNTGRASVGGCGIQTSALAFGGGGPAVSAATESWNGTSWTSVNSLNTAREKPTGAGVSNTAALAFGGIVYTPGFPGVAATESWNGTSWTSVNSLNTARGIFAGAGIQTLALAFGGAPAAPAGATAATELWNGTSWTSNPTGLATARKNLSGAGTQTSALAFGGFTTAVTAATEEWIGDGAVTKTITTS